MRPVKQIFLVPLTVAAMAILTLSACGKEAQTESKPDRGRQSLVKDSPRQSRQPSALKRRSLPPDGVERQVTFAFEGGTRSVCLFAGIWALRA